MPFWQLIALRNVNVTALGRSEETGNCWYGLSCSYREAKLMRIHILVAIFSPFVIFFTFRFLQP